MSLGAIKNRTIKVRPNLTPETLMFEFPITNLFTVLFFNLVKISFDLQDYYR